MTPQTLKPGDEVIVHVDADVMAKGSPANPRGRFVRYQADGAWADVELEADHIGSNASRERSHHMKEKDRESKARTLSVPIALVEVVTLLLLVLFGARSAKAQTSYTTPQSITQNLASGVNCTGGTQYFSVNSIGQTQHYATISTSSGITQAQVQILGQMVGGGGSGFAFPISDSDYIAANSIQTLSATGQFPNVEIAVTCQPTSATFTLFYVGTSATSNVNSGSYLLAQLDKAVFSGAASQTSQSGFIATLPYGSSYGVISYTNSGSTGASINVTCSGQATTGNVNISFPAGTFGSLVVPAAPCTKATVNWNTGGATVGQLNLDYLFLPPGAQISVSASSLTNPINFGQVVEKGPRWSQVSAPAAGTQATAVKTAGANGTRHVADCVSYSAAASTAPTATTLSIDLLDNTTVIWAKTVAAPAATGTHVSGDVCGLNLIGSANQSMTLEFTAGLTNESESVTLTGYDVQ